MVSGEAEKCDFRVEERDEVPEAASVSLCCR